MIFTISYIDPGSSNVVINFRKPTRKTLIFFLQKFRNMHMPYSMKSLQLLMESMVLYKLNSLVVDMILRQEQSLFLEDMFLEQMRFVCHICHFYSYIKMR